MSDLPAPSRLEPIPRRISRRGVAVLVVGVLAFIAVFLVVLRLYWVEGGVKVDGGISGPGGYDIGVDISPVELDPKTNTLTLQLAFNGTSDSAFDAQGNLLKNTRIFVYSLEGVQEYKYVAGDQLGRAEIRVGVDGQEADYPFDHYEGLVGFAADTYSKGSDGSLVSNGDLTVGLIGGQGGIDGWDTSMQLAQGASTYQTAELSSSRAFSTQLFAIMLLALMTTLTGSAFWFAILVFTKRRTAEVALLAWSASLLFALPLLRNSLPNGPPIGATIDITVFLWVLVMALVASLLLIYSYLGQRGAELLAAAEREARDAP